MQDLARTVQAISRSESWRAVTDLVRAWCRPHGYDRFVLWSAAARAEDVIGRLYWVEGEWFDSGEAVDAETYLRRCPVNQHLFETEQPFFWTKIDGSYRLTPSPRGPGLHGLQVPVFGASGLKGAVSFGGARIDTSFAMRLSLVALAGAAFEAATLREGAASASSPARLTLREREVMRWIAAGKRQADAAQLLGLSERTVENHLRRIRARLGASTTAEAVRIAVSAGEIEV